MSVTPPPAPLWTGQGNRVVVIGDSIVANGCNNVAPNTTASTTSITDRKHGALGPRNWLLWASLYSNSRILYGGMAATGSYTSAQVESTHLPVVLAAPVKPAACVVLCGTGDVPIGDATARATLLRIYRALAGAGILPVVCGLTPRNDAKGAIAIMRLNVWLSRVAAAKGWPFVDFWPAVAASDGGWTSGLNGDNVHPNSAGELMGQTLSNVLSTYLPPVTQNIANSNTDALPATGNCLMATDTNADGVPDGWTTAAGPTPALVTDAGNVLGKWFQQTRAAGDVASISGTLSKVEGNLVRVECRINSTVEATGGAARWRLADNNFSGDVMSMPDWDRDVPPRTLVMEAVVPSGLSGSNLQFAFFGDGAAGDIVRVGQFRHYDLTAQGIDTP